MKRPPWLSFTKDTSFLLWLFLSLYLLFSMISITLSYAVLFFALLSWLQLLIKNRRLPRFPSFFWPLLVYSLFSLISAFLSVNPEISLIDSRELLLFLIIPLVYSGMSSVENIKNAQFALLASAGISSLYSFFYFIFQAAPGERITGFMGHPLTQAGLLLLFLSVALSHFLFSKEKSRYFWAVGCILALVALSLTLTRSAWVGLAVAAAFILALYKPRALFIIPVILVLFFLLSPKHVKSRILSIFSTRSYSNAQRIEYLHAGIKIVKDYPLFGTGPNTVDMVFQNPKYGLSDLSKQNVHLHNNITQIGAERGIPALLAWLTFIGWTFLSLLKLLRNKDPTFYPLTISALAALLALCTAGLFEYNFGDSEITILFLTIITLPFIPRKESDASKGNE
jgi:O-antigen ligase